MANMAMWNAGDRPAVRINWDSFVAQGFDTAWRDAVTDALINAYTRWMAAGVDCRPRFEGYTTRTQPNDGEILVTSNERHFTSSRIASTFGNWRKASLVIHRRNGSNPTFPLWNFVPHNAVAGQIDLQGIFTHELGHCFWLDDTSTDATMNGGYEYHRQRLGPWPLDLDGLHGIYPGMTRNRLRAFGSTDGITWTPRPSALTSLGSTDARTTSSPNVTSIGRSGRLLASWSIPNQIPSHIRTDVTNVITPPWFFYGGERSLWGPTVADADDGTLLWAWAWGTDGRIRVARSTNEGSNWGFVGAPPGAATASKVGLASTRVGGQKVWMLAWSHLDRAAQNDTGQLRVSLSFNDGGSWTAPVTVGPSYRALNGVSLAASPSNQFVLAFAWGNRSIVHRNLVRSLDLSVAGGAVSIGRAATHNGASRIQPSVVFHPGTNRFILAYREQNYLTSIRVTRRSWNSSSGWPAATQIPVTTHTAPALAVDRASGRLTVWYAVD